MSHFQSNKRRGRLIVNASTLEHQRYKDAVSEVVELDHSQTMGFFIAGIDKVS